jgi:hypothetical protein
MVWQSHGHYKPAAEDDTFLLRAYSWLNFSILSLLNATPGTGLRMSLKAIIIGITRRIYSSFTLLAIFRPERQAGCRCPSNVPLRAPVRNAVHSEWVNDNTGPARSLEFRTSTDRPTKATSTQSLLADASLFRHSMLFRPDSAIRLSFDQAKKLRGRSPRRV